MASLTGDETIVSNDPKTLDTFKFQVEARPRILASECGGGDVSVVVPTAEGDRFIDSELLLSTPLFSMVTGHRPPSLLQLGVGVGGII